MNAYQDLIKQIDHFIRKYYLNKMLKGVLFFLIVFSSTYLLVTTLEFFGRFNSVVRAFLLFSFILVNGYIFFRYFWISLMKLFSFGKQISHFQAAEIIGQFFPDVSDKLLNTLQLNESLNDTSSSVDLLKASIDQRSKSFSKLNFSSAIDIKKDSKKYVYYLLPLFFVFLTVSMILPDFFTQSSTRVWHFNQYFKPKAPFDFILNKSKYRIEEGEEIKIDLKLKGTILPERVFIVSQQGKFLMNKESNSSYNFVLNNIRSSSTFYFVANDYESDLYNIEVLGKSGFKFLKAILNYPSYLGKKSESIENVGDMLVPEGTIITWNGVVKNSKQLQFISKSFSKTIQDEDFKWNTKHLESSKVKFILHNSGAQLLDTFSYNVEVIKDEYPTINVVKVSDSLKPSTVYFKGFAADDIGIKSLKFHYMIDRKGKKSTKVLDVQPVKGTASSFQFGFNFMSLDLQTNDKLTYYFQVTDNDGIHGGKSARSYEFEYELPSLEELNDNRDDLLTESSQSLQSLLDKTNEFNKNVNRLKKDVLNSKNNDFSKLNQVKQLKQQQKELQKELQNVKQQLEESNQTLDELSAQDQEVLEKQELLDELLNEVMDEELMNLLNELEDLMKDNQSKEDIKEQIDDIELSSEEMNRQLDRSIEMLKKLQVNEKIDALEKELNELSKKQEGLSTKVEENKISNQEAQSQQKEIDQDFQKLMEELKDVQEKNEELKNPMNLGDQESLKNETQNNINQAKENLSKSKSSKASSNQKNAAEGMKKIAQDLDKNQKESNKKQEQEDIKTLKAILESLITLSFKQEELRDKFNNTKSASSSYSTFVKEQQKIISSTNAVKDSLLALAKRQPKVASFIDKELTEIQRNFNYIVEDLDEHKRSPLSVHQQTVMTSYNNLALLLNESLQQLQQQMKSNESGSGSCENPTPGSGKPKPGKGSVGDLKEMLQDQLNQMKKGNQPGGSNPGGSQLGMSAKDFSKMAAQQAAIRQRLESLRNELNKDGKGSGNMLNPLIQELEKQEKELINKQLNPTVIKRQQQILTRLLESEKALLERGFDDKRQSNQGKNFENGNQIQFDEYTKQRLQQIEMLKSVDPMYEQYYKDKAYEYFNGVE